jgi:hypothetical protein
MAARESRRRESAAATSYRMTSRDGFRRNAGRTSNTSRGAEDPPGRLAHESCRAPLPLPSLRRERVNHDGASPTAVLAGVPRLPWLTSDDSVALFRADSRARPRPGTDGDHPPSLAPTGTGGGCAEVVGTPRSLNTPAHAARWTTPCSMTTFSLRGSSRPLLVQPSVGGAVRLPRFSAAAISRSRRPRLPRLGGRS